MGIEPIGFLVIHEKEISFLSTDKSSKGLAAAFEKVSDLAEKMMNKKDIEANPS